MSKSKLYTPKRKSYNDLSTLYREMRASKVKVLSFNGHCLETKHQKWGMYEGVLTVWEL